MSGRYELQYQSICFASDADKTSVALDVTTNAYSNFTIELWVLQRSIPNIRLIYISIVRTKHQTQKHSLC